MFEKIRDIIAEELSIAKEKVTMEAKLTEDLGADSLDAVELIMAIEDAFDIQVSDEAAEKIECVGDIVKYVESIKK